MEPNKTSRPWPVTRLVVNGKTVDIIAPADMPLLWALRDVLALTGTKFGCGIGQCGYCQSGQIMSASALIARNPRPNDRDIDVAMSGNLCRCCTYARIRAAIKAA
jgi:isoquinoline 1-oxidoreductase subunit alpha